MLLYIYSKLLSLNVKNYQTVASKILCAIMMREIPQRSLYSLLIILVLQHIFSLHSSLRTDSMTIKAMKVILLFTTSYCTNFIN